MRKYTLHEYFYFTRLERNASITLFVLCIVFFLLPSIFPLFISPKPSYDFESYRSAIAAATSEKMVAETEARDEAIQYRAGAEKKEVVVEPFHFDPNTATKDELVSLGIPPRTVQTLLNYRSKGGRFLKKEDLAKIYGMREEDVERLEPWIVIAKREPSKRQEHIPKTALENQGEEVAKNVQPPPVFEKKRWEPEPIDINSATAEDWQQLRGIGPGYSKRITRFRDKLGGFHSIEQVSETYGLPDSTFQQILPYLQFSGGVFRKLNVNAATLEELKMHPYLSNFQATVVFNYRKQHGTFDDMVSLRKVKAGFKEEDWLRLEPYLAFE